MDADAFNAFCRGLPATTHVVQWGGSDVWKVGGKVFAVGGWARDGAAYGVSFKVTQMMFDLLRDRDGFRPAPYLAARGMLWIQRHAQGDMADAELAELIGRSHAMIAAKLPRRLRAELELDEAGAK